MTCKKAGVAEFANENFGLTAKEFGDNLMEYLLTHVPINPEPDPEVLASEFLNSSEHRREYHDVGAVLSAARYVLAREISCDPRVRQSLRNTFYERAEISTYPTHKGMKEIDHNHAYFNVKRLDKKPTAAFRDSAHFLQIAAAEKENFITVDITIRNEADFLQEVEQLYLSDGYSLNAQKWNEQRRLVLKEALTAHLYPLFKTELRAKLAQEATDFILLNATDHLRSELLRGPFRPISKRSSTSYYGNNDDDDEYDDKKKADRNTRVMGCVWSQGEVPTICIVTDRFGQPVELLKLNFINMRSDSNAPELDRRRKEEDLDRLRDFISDHTPHAIVLGAGPGEVDSRRFMEDLKRAASDAEERKNLHYRIHVAYADSRLAKIFKNSFRSLKEFPDYAPLAREAVGLARFLQDPLIEYCGLNSDGAEEVLCLSLHPLQQLVPKEVLHHHLLRTFIDVVNEVGLDINHALRHKFAAGPLQFVAGLGPRKAQALLQALERKGGLVSSREEIGAILSHDDEDYVSVVYKNCAGFIRVCKKYFPPDHHALIDPLDDTRIHPEDYTFARKMAADALEEEESDGASQVETVIKNPYKLEDIDLESFAEEWERSGKGKKALALQDIRKELGHPYADPRHPYEEPTPDQLFYLLTGEIENTFRPGQLVHAKVLRANQTMVFCRLENGLSGVIHINDLTDSASHLSPESLVTSGQYLTCRILRIDKHGFRVDLASSNSKLNDFGLARNMALLDPYLLEKEAEQTEFPHERLAPRKGGTGEQLKAPPRKKPQRTITHPLFKSCSWRDAEDQLSDKEPGEDAIIIRPSSRGWDHLNISWKLTQTICVHTDAVERNKKWEVEGQLFEDLDEVVYRFVVPMAEYGREMQSYRLYSPEDRETIVAQLSQDRKNNPNRIPYYIIPSRDRPRSFLIAYWFTQPRFEGITVTPEGFRYHGRYFQHLEKLISSFKANFRSSGNSRAAGGAPGAGKEMHGQSSRPALAWGGSS